MHGGRIRGQGTYGCVFQPALLCRGMDTMIDGTKVGKITSYEDAENEIRIANHLRKLPDSSLYTILPESKSCVPRARSKQQDKDIKECEFTDTTPLDKTIQLIMPWGGYPLSRINLDPISFNYYTFIENMLAIGTYFILNDVCHFDIWGQNILFDNKTKPRLIDYGFAFQPSKLKQSDLPARWRVIAVDHDTETPEVTLMIGKQHGLEPASLAREVQLSKPAVQRLVTLCDVTPSDWANELVEWSQESQTFQHHNWLGCWKLYWPGFDAWSIGALLLQVLELQIAIPSFSQSAEWKKHGSHVKHIMRGLCRGNPANRIDAAEALSEWTNGAHPLIADGSIGSDWVYEKKRQRQNIHHF